MYKDMMDTIGFVSGYDPELGAAMQRELGRQQANIELIASENIVSPAVMAAMGSVLTNKYAEGYPGHRYYGGSCLVPNMPTCSPIPAHRPTWPFTLPCSTWAIPSWAWIFPRAAI